MKTFRYFVLAAGIALTSAPVGAMPVTPENGSTRMDITQIAAGCGPGMIRGPYGHCRRAFSCPPGFRPGPKGQHCYRIKR